MAGRQTPIEAEEICSALFAAGERIGRPDPFLARELTDGVFHFLGEGSADDPPARTEMIETVGKVVRELGHPRLAHAFAEIMAGHGVETTLAVSSSDDLIEGFLIRPGPATSAAEGVFRDSLREWSLDRHYPPDLAAAHREGLIDLGGLEIPREFHAAAVSIPPGEGTVGSAVYAVRQYVAGTLALDGPDHSLAVADADPDRAVEGFVRELDLAVRGTGLSVVVNLNSSEPPALSHAPPHGPLFASPASADHHSRREEIARRLHARLSSLGYRTIWHVPAEGPERGGSLPAGLERTDVVFDRARRPILLGDGLDRDHPFVLSEVGVRLDWLAGQMAQGSVDLAFFLQKLGSLVRLAKSSGRVRKEILKRFGRDEVREGFRLDRARLVLRIIGWTEALACLQRPSPGDTAEILRHATEVAGLARPRWLDVCVPIPDRPWGTPPADWRDQVREGSSLIRASNGGVWEVCLDDPAGAAEVIRACCQAGLNGIRFRRPDDAKG